jgi:hypothetical protein
MCHVDVYVLKCGLYLVMKSGFRPRLSMLNMATSSPANLHTLTAMLAYTHTVAFTQRGVKSTHTQKSKVPTPDPATHSVSTLMP